MTNDRLELDWLAFQYIAGELTAEETVGFEDRLAVDQEAREAVARAVELAEVATFAEDRPVELVTIKAPGAARPGAARPGAARPGVVAAVWTRRLAWMACGAAACLLLIVFVQPFGTNQLTTVNDLAVNDLTVNNKTVNNNNETGESPELALAWAQARADASADDASEAGDGPAVDENGSEEDGIAAPSWMLAAVAGLTFGPEEVD